MGKRFRCQRCPIMIHLCSGTITRESTARYLYPRHGDQRSLAAVVRPGSISVFPRERILYRTQARPHTARAYSVRRSSLTADDKGRPHDHRQVRELRMENAKTNRDEKMRQAVCTRAAGSKGSSQRHRHFSPVVVMFACPAQQCHDQSGLG